LRHTSSPRGAATSAFRGGCIVVGWMQSHPYAVARTQRNQRMKVHRMPGH
jgi:hypothetical protein